MAEVTELRRRTPRDVEPDAGLPPRKIAMNTLARHVEHNAAKNKANRAAEAAKKELHKTMAKANLKSVDITVDGTRHTATIEAGENTVIDVRALFDKVDLDTFLKIVTASKAAITEEVGSNVAASVSSTVKTDPGLKLSKEKL